MRFLLLTQYFLPEIGAAPVRLSAIAKELTKLGHEVDVVTALPNYPTSRIFPSYRGLVYKKEEDQGVHIHRVWVYAAQGAGIKRLINYASFAVMSLLALFRLKKADYVFVESPPLFLAPTGYLFARILSAKLIFNVSDLWPDTIRELQLMKDDWKMRLAERLEKWAYKKADIINVPTEGIERKLIEKKAVPPEKVLFFPNGVDTAVFRPMDGHEAFKNELGLSDKKTILYAGTHSLGAGMEVAIRAAKRLTSRPDILFLFVGDGPAKKGLIKMTTDEKLDNVRFLDPVPPQEVARLYSVCSAGLCTLRNSKLFEGTRPAKIFPAMAAGLPVVYSGAGEGARLLMEAHAGVITPPEDDEALARAVEKLIDSPEDAKVMGQNGKKYVEENLTWTSIVKAWLKKMISP